MLDLSDAKASAQRLRQLYEKLETQRYGRPWNVSEIALGFVGDVGDLAKLIQSYVGVRGTEDVQAELAHELSDCLWSILVIADAVGVDLEQAYPQTVAELSERVSGLLDDGG